MTDGSAPPPLEGRVSTVIREQSYAKHDDRDAGFRETSAEHCEKEAEPSVERLMHWARTPLHRICKLGLKRKTTPGKTFCAECVISNYIQVYIIYSMYSV